MRCFLISSLLLCTAGSALADRKISPAALVELERGEALFRDKEYAAAIEAFDAGYALDPQPIFLYDKAQALRLAGDCRSAVASYAQFLATQPPAGEATRARKNIASCEATLPPPPAPEPVVVREPAPIEAVPVRAPELAVTEQQAWWRDGIGMTLVTAGGLGLGIGAGFAVAARAAADDSGHATHVDEWEQSQRRYDHARMFSVIALGTGAALVTIGVLRLSLRDRSVHLAPTQGSGAVVSLGGAW